VTAAVTSVRAGVYRFPTPAPEADGTFCWDATTAVTVQVDAGGRTGLGWTYSSPAAAALVSGELAGVLTGRDAFDVPGAWAAMHRAGRNLGTRGLFAQGLSAVDVALWDLKARALGTSLVSLLGRRRERVAVYGSGGFCSYSDAELAEQLGGWAAEGIPRVKMKVGRDAADDPRRVAVAREAVGDDVELMVDANGAYARKEAVAWAERFAEFGVTYFEEPVSSDDLEGLRMVRDRAPAGMVVAAGEYGWDLPHFQRLLDAGAVDVLQADVTRCGGITALLAIEGLCKARGVPFSAHCAPAISVHACCAVETLAHLEYFHDHVAVERRLFDGVVGPEDGHLRPDRSRLGLGLELKRVDAAEFVI
jgi:L-alanine-DL-glutamate epimerase-like enolase superfamily enzyme